MSSEEIKVKKAKKERKEKKPKKPSAEQDEEVPLVLEKDEDEEELKEEKSKKRKREPIPEELEIDVSLPEPPSKKALRKSKKAKTTTSTTATDDAQNSDHEDGADTVKTTTVKEKEEKERRTEHSIWIGNLPWTANKQDLRDFLADQASIQDSQITRVHMPAPSAAQAKDTRGRPAFKNKGFAYVDFDSQETLFSALQLTETAFDRSGRKVLVKNARSFEGRPEEHVNAKKDEGARGSKGKGGNEDKPASKRVFVGNLAFEITKEDLETHFGQCGEIENIHMATFEDSGKCKGYAWITFHSLESAELAVRGFILKDQEDDEDVDAKAAAGEEDDDGEKDAKPARKKKPRKWFVNRLFGREIKREYAEDASVRYKKRYGGDRKRQDGDGEEASAPIREVHENGSGEAERAQQKSTSHDRRREQRRAQKYGQGFKKVDARTIAPGAALAHAPRASGAINADGKKGTKVTFD